MQEPHSSSQVQPLVSWLSRYGSTHYDWHHLEKDGQTILYRQMGMVEGFFDIDGTEFEGRADIHANLSLEVRFLGSSEELRRRILLAWAILRTAHALLSARALNGAELLPQQYQSSAVDQRFFVIREPQSLQQMVQEASEHLILAQDKGYTSVDPDIFLTHLLNTARCIEPSNALARLIVLPEERKSKSTVSLHCMLVVAHQISDGLTIFRWMSHFVDLLNLSVIQLEKVAEQVCGQSMTSRLPPAQESLYPPVQGSLARQRWSWLISRLLRHTRRPPPASFLNPLRRTHSLSQAESLSEGFPGLLSYSKTPPLNSFTLSAPLSTPATHNLIRLCRQARISIGAGCFALVGLVMMIFYERRFPEIPLGDRKPFVGSFPLNPRPFLAGKPTTGNEDSLMLAFSDGLALPFLPSYLPVEGRFRLLGKMAHRQLRVYQKRPQGPAQLVELGSRSPSQMIPSLYLGSLERLEAKAPPERKTGMNAQGTYTTRLSETGATCGVSSVGDRTKLIASKYDVYDESKDFVADFRSFRSVVKARDNEFLVGAAGDPDCLEFSVSYDGCAIDPGLAEEWGKEMQTILLPANVRANL